jgi:hypothetical protein
MKQQSLASQGVFEKYGRKSRRELFWTRWRRWFRGSRWSRCGRDLSATSWVSGGDMLSPPCHLITVESHYR